MGRRPRVGKKTLLAVAVGGGLLWATSRSRNKVTQRRPRTTTPARPVPVVPEEPDEDVLLSERAHRRRMWIGWLVFLTFAVLGMQHEPIFYVVDRLYCIPPGCSDMRLVVAGWLLAVVPLAPALLSRKGLLHRSLAFPMSMLAMAVFWLIYMAFTTSVHDGTDYPFLYPLPAAYFITALVVLPANIAVAVYGIKPGHSYREVAYTRLLAASAVHVVLLVVTLVLMS